MASKSKVRRLETSPQLQRLLLFLSNGKSRTSREIQIHTDICDLQSAMYELRQNGIDVVCYHIGRNPMTNANIFAYQLAEFAAPGIA